ncbi:unnamed protein product [Auanema sp. JU1783]|nr:unnamed protein product [Auanema sp. JU1783]
MINRSHSDTAGTTSGLTYQRKYVSQKNAIRTPAVATRQLCSLRLYSSEGDRSTVASISKETTSQQISDNYKVEALYVQLGNFQIKCLPPESSPLLIFVEHITAIGFTDVNLRNFGADNDLRSVIAFFLGRPTINPTSLMKSEILLAECYVRRGTVLHKWHRYKCILYNGTIRIQKDTGEDDVLHLNRFRVDLHETRRGRCLRVSDANGNGFTLFCFDDQETLLLWLTRSQQSVQSNSVDLSDQQLTILPENLFSLASANLKKLNLRRNSLRTEPIRSEKKSLPHIGFLEDLNRLQYLTFLDISANRLKTFPDSITSLLNLVHLNLSSNRISSMPSNIKALANLSHMDVSNNELSTLPIALSQCVRLTHLNLAFNSFSEIPLVLTRMNAVRNWLLSGNRIELIDTYYDILDLIEKLDLSRNNLDSTFRLPTGKYSNLAYVDIRDNYRVSAIYLTNLAALQNFYCSRLQLTALYLNGQSLLCLQADHNLLDTIVVMPIPSMLQTLDISYNQVEQLPDWICDLQHLSTLKAHNNKISFLPKRIFCMPNLRVLAMQNNTLTNLPSEFEECPLDSLFLQHNRLRELPAMLFKFLKRLRHFNVTNNSLNILPPSSAHIDSNRIQTLRLSGNQFDETIVPTVVSMKRLKVLDLSNNRLRYFDDSALPSLSFLEEINISSNKLTTISTSIPELNALTTLRAHSNQIQKMPDLSSSMTLQLVDLSNNHISQFHPSFTTALNLRFLDVTCNSGLQVDGGTLRHRKKNVSLVNIGSEDELIQVGFAETTGSKNRLCIRRIRHGNIIGLVDGGTNYELPKAIVRTMLDLIETNENYNLANLMLNTHISIGEQAERLGASATLIRIGQTYLEMSSSGGIGLATISNDNNIQIYMNNGLDEQEYMEVRRLGHIVDENNLINGLTPYARQLGLYYLHPAVVPNPISQRIPISNIDYVIIASRALWDHLTLPLIMSNVCRSLNPQVASKRLQDCLQACDYNGNSSISVIRIKKPEQVFHSPPSSEAPYIPMRRADYMEVNQVTPDGTHLNFTKMDEEKTDKVSQPYFAFPKTEEDEGFVSGRQLYRRILADEIGYSNLDRSMTEENNKISTSSISSLETSLKTLPTFAPPPPPPPPPDPNTNDMMVELQKTISAKRIQLESDEKTSVVNDSIEPRSSEGKYNVIEETRQYLEQKLTDNTRVTSNRRLTVISEDNGEDLALDDALSFSHHSVSGSQVPTNSVPDFNSMNSALTPVEQSFSNRYRFEYASNVPPQMEITKEIRRSGLSFDL